MTKKSFVLGKEPDPKLNITGEVCHPYTDNRSVRFVKDVRTDALYMNVRDFVQPYKNNKYRIVFKRLVPNCKLGEMWVLLDVMVAIVDASNNPKSITAVINEIKAGELF